MNGKDYIEMNSSIVAQIEALPMTQSERRLAVSALRNSSLVTDAIVRALESAAGLFSRAALKPSLKH